MYIDCCLPFGLRSAPKIFTTVADAFEWILVHQGENLVEFVIRYLDDFLFVRQANTATCKESLDLTFMLCKKLGIPVMPGKVARYWSF